MSSSFRPFAAVILAMAVSGTAYAQIGGLPGASTRIGFGTRGIAMGNAMTAVDAGELSPYYNPALLPFSASRAASVSTGFLSLDRTFNSLNFSTPLPPAAGFGVALLNTGVSAIDGRDGDGHPTGQLKTAENTVYLGFGMKFPFGLSVGVSLKLLYAHLYTDISSTSVGVDVGAFYRVNEWLRVGATARDIGSKYKWDTGNLYGEQGKQTQDNFPRLYTAGVACLLPDSFGVLSMDIQTSTEQTLHLSFGAEVPIIPELTLRAGIDRLDLKESGTGASPAVGFLLQRTLGQWTPAIQYTYVFEPFTASGIHLVSVSAHF